MKAITKSQILVNKFSALEVSLLNWDAKVLVYHICLPTYVLDWGVLLKVECWWIFSEDTP